MNFDELKKTLNEFKKEIENGLNSTEQYTAFKENLEKLRATAKKNPFFATLSEVIINPLSKELERAYKKFTDSEQSTASYQGFDLVNDPKAMEKIQSYLQTLESSYANMDAEKFTTALEPLLNVVNDLDRFIPENSKEEDFADDVRRRVIQLKLSASRVHASPAQPSTALVFRYHQTPFNITHKDFAGQYRAYMEDLAVNAAAKNVQQLLEAGQILQIIEGDLKQTQAESDDEEKLLQEVAIQTPLLLKIVDRQIALKSSAMAQYNAQKDQKSSKDVQTPKQTQTSTKKKSPTKSSSKLVSKTSVVKPVKKPVKKTTKVAKKAAAKSTATKKPKSKKVV